MRAFKVARLCCPVQLQLLMPNAAALQEFENFPFVDDNTIANLAVELPAYLAAADDIVDLSKEQQLASSSHTPPLCIQPTLRQLLGGYSSFSSALLLLGVSSAYSALCLLSRTMP